MENENTKIKNKIIAIRSKIDDINIKVLHLKKKKNKYYRELRCIWREEKDKLLRYKYKVGVFVKDEDSWFSDITVGEEYVIITRMLDKDILDLFCDPSIPLKK
jgi:uncharacterized protein YfkK (UPF0435 family)